MSPSAASSAGMTEMLPSARAVYGAILEVFADAVEQHDADRLVERADRPCADGRDSHEEVLVKHLTAADVFDRGQQDMAAEQQIRRDHQNDFDRRHRNDQTRDKERRADQHFRERVTAFLILLLLLGGDDLDLALDIRADFADFREQSVRVFSLDAQLFGFVDEHAVVDAVELADLVLHLGGAVGAAEVFERVDTLAVFAVVSGRRCDDLRLALDARADLADFREQGIRVFAGHAQLLGFKDKHAVLHAVQLTDALLHFRRAVGAADVLEGVHALDTVRTGGVLVMMVMMFVVVVVAAAAVVIIVVMMMVMLVLVVVAAAAVVIIVVVVVMVVVLVLVVVAAATVVVIVVMMMLVLVAAAAVIVIIVVVVMMFVLVVVTAAAVVVIVMVVVMLVLVVVAAAAVVVIVVVVVMLVLMVVTAAAVVVIVMVVVMVFVLVVVAAAAVVIIVVMVVVFVRFFYFLCVRSGFFLLLFCHCCRLLIRNNI